MVCIVYYKVLLYCMTKVFFCSTVKIRLKCDTTQSLNLAYAYVGQKREYCTI
jgi:hypothetical protein